MSRMIDSIDRQEAIDAIGTWDKFGVDERCRIVRWHEGLEPYVKLRDVLTAIVNLPAAQPEQRWIPCSERPPEKSGQYYVSGGGKVWICEFVILNSFTGVIGGWCNDATNPVVQAWMPLPEPYTERREK